MFHLSGFYRKGLVEGLLQDTPFDAALVRAHLTWYPQQARRRAPSNQERSCLALIVNSDDSSLERGPYSICVNCKKGEQQAYIEVIQG